MINSVYKYKRQNKNEEAIFVFEEGTGQISVNSSQLPEYFSTRKVGNATLRVLDRGSAKQRYTVVRREAIKDKRSIEYKSTLRLTKEKLGALIDSVKRHKYVVRSEVKKLREWYWEDINNKTAILFGLRRTGKTVLLIQFAEEMMGVGENVVFIRCHIGSKMSELTDAIESAIKGGSRLVLIDEITWVKGFYYWCRELVEDAWARGVRLVFAGTDSLQFVAVDGNPLFGMTYKVRMSPIRFAEHQRLFKGATAMDFVRSGGILDSKSNIEGYEEYIKGSIEANIYRTIRSLGESADQEFHWLYKMEQRGILRNIFVSFIMKSNVASALKSISETFKDSNLSIGLRNSRVGFDMNRKDIKVWHREMAACFLCKCNISKIGVNGNDILAVVDVLHKIGALTYRKGYEVGLNKVDETVEAIFTQFGMRMSLAEVTGKEVYSSYDKRGLSEEQMQRIRSSITSSIEGEILEDVVAFTMIEKYGYNNVYKVRMHDRQEIDLVIETESGKALVEVKSSEEIRVIDQAKWLLNREMNSWLEENPNATGIDRRIVVYNGVNKDIFVDSEEGKKIKIEYINATEFLNGF
jgi:predicted AAA+ superfamily ATPase